MLGMKNHFDISGIIEIREVDIAGVACIFVFLTKTPTFLNLVTIKLWNNLSDLKKIHVFTPYFSPNWKLTLKLVSTQRHLTTFFQPKHTRFGEKIITENISYDYSHHFSVSMIYSLWFRVAFLATSSNCKSHF